MRAKPSGSARPTRSTSASCASCAPKPTWKPASAEPDALMPPRLALVAGEPGGVGPELCVRLAQRSQPGELVAIADPDTLRAAAGRLGLPLRLRDPGGKAGAGELALLPRPH